MTRDDIIRMAREAGAIPIHKQPKELALVKVEKLERFAALVAAAEREACAKVCDEPGTVEQWDGLSEAADRIRARGQA